MIIKRAHDQQALFAYENPVISTLIFRIVQPWAGDGHVLGMMGSLFAGSAKLEGFPVPRRPRDIPFRDELPEKPVDEKTRDLVQKAFLDGVVGGILWIISTKAFRSPSLGP